ncbi:DUF3592 domain-containing protein [Anatilimnocola floriformis]|uniref:DUF3592 domain-containing protein n=1 Tax=Anatilimnocola floriformis TaxID=2948575 RepID=UPI0020C3AA44|nr:DUF3592 domain-containing protein [Anatilimnocola floriformis]
MPIEVACRCGQRFRADERHIGQQAKCSGCGNILTIQAAPAASTPPAAPAAKPQQIVVACQCGARFAARPELAGKTVACPQCKQPLTIGAAGPKTPSAQPARPQPAPQPVAPQPAPLGDSLWDDLPAAGGSLGPAVSLPPTNPLGASASPSYSGGRRHIGIDLMAGRPMKEVIAGVILSILALFAGIGLWIALSQVDAERGDSSKWPSTTGTIKSAQVVEDGLYRGRQKYRAKIEYTYEVNGVPHTSDRLQLGNSPTGRSFTADMAVSKYAPGSTHPVYYKPTEPSMAVLEAGKDFGYYIIPLAALVLGLIGVVGLGVTAASLVYRMT